MPALMPKRPSTVLGEIRRELDQRRKFAAVAKGRIMKQSTAPSPIPKAATGAAIQRRLASIPHKPAIKKPFPSTPRAPAISYVPLEQAPKRFTAPKGRPTPFAMNGSGVAIRGIEKPSLPMPQKPSEAAATKEPFVQMPRKPAEAAATKEPFVQMPRKPAEAAATKESSVPVSRSTPPPRPSSAGLETIQKGSRVCVRTPMGTLPTGMSLFIWLSAVVVSDAEEGYFEVQYNGAFPRDDPSRDVRVARDQVKIMPSSHR